MGETHPEPAVAAPVEHARIGVEQTHAGVQRRRRPGGQARGGHRRTRAGADQLCGQLPATLDPYASPRQPATSSGCHHRRKSGCGQGEIQPGKAFDVHGILAGSMIPSTDGDDRSGCKGRATTCRVEPPRLRICSPVVDDFIIVALSGLIE
jgi:hypothetical protein